MTAQVSHTHTYIQARTGVDKQPGGKGQTSRRLGPNMGVNQMKKGGGGGLMGVKQYSGSTSRKDKNLKRIRTATKIPRETSLSSSSSSSSSSLSSSS